MPLGVWEYDRDDGALPGAAAAHASGLEPDFTVDVVSSRGDHLTVQIASGAVADPASILHVEGRGTFEIVRIEPWPRRLVLVLRAWASRDG